MTSTTVKYKATRATTVEAESASNEGDDMKVVGVHNLWYLDPNNLEKAMVHVEQTTLGYTTAS